MKIFESFKNIGDPGSTLSTQLVAAKLLCGLIEACIDGNGSYEPEDDGRIVLIEETDTEEMIEFWVGASRTPSSSRASWKEGSSSPAFWRMTSKAVR